MPQSRSAPRALRLGVNIDHVATLRNARGGATPDPVRAALMAAEAAGAPADFHPRSRAIAPLPPWRDAYVAAWPAIRDRLQSARNHAGEDGL